jgi:hypothetical protein
VDRGKGEVALKGRGKLTQYIKKLWCKEMIYTPWKSSGSRKGTMVSMAGCSDHTLLRVFSRFVMEKRV